MKGNNIHGEFKHKHGGLNFLVVFSQMSKNLIMSLF